MSPDTVPSASRDLPGLDAADPRSAKASVGTPERKPMPSWMPYAAAVLLLGCAGAATLPLLSSRTAEAPDPSPASMPSPLVEAPSVEDQLAAARAETAALASDQTQAKADLENALAGLRQELSRLGEETRALRAAVNADLPAAADAATAGSDNAVLQAAIDSLALQLDGLVAPTAKPPSASPARRRPRPVAVRPPAPPPFDVLAVDVWGGEPQLTVRDSVGVRHVSLGQSVDGWRLTGAEAGGGAVTLQDPRGRTASYTLAGTTLAATPVVTAPLPTLTVAAEPADARIRVMNVGPAYHDRMPLPPGAYDVLVDRHGYEPSRQWVRLDADRVVSVWLAPAAGAAEPTR